MAVTALPEGVIQMIWLAKLKPLVVAAAALIIATASVAVQGRQEPAIEGTREQVKTTPPTAAVAAPDMAANRAIARKQLAVIDETWSFLMDLVPNHRIDIAAGQFGLWGRRRLEALRRAGAGKVEIVAALEKHINELKELEVIAKARVEGGWASKLDVHEAQFLRMEAEVWLNEEKAR